MRNPGTIAIMEDGRKVIIYNNQPLKEKGKVIVHLIDEDFQPIKENGKMKTLLFDLPDYNKKIKGWKGIGKVD